MQELLFLHERMLQLAEEGKWTDVAAAEAIRRKRLEHYFQKPVDREQVDQVRGALESMLELNNRILLLVKKGRGGVGQDISEIQKGRRAMAAYGKNTDVSTGSIRHRGQ